MGDLKPSSNCHVNMKNRNFRNLDEDQIRRDLHSCDRKDIKLLADVN